MHDVEGMRARAIAGLVAAAVACAAGLTACHDKGADTKKAPQPGQDKPAPTGSGVIQGVVKLVGAPPAPTPWGGKGFVGCKGKHAEDIQLVKAQGGLLEEAFVYVKDGLPAGYYTPPTTPVVVDQKACEFVPRVFAAMTDQPISWANSDAVMHNVNTGQFNQALPSQVGPFPKPLQPAEGPSPVVMVRCDVHPWMRAYAGVLDHPYFAVTKADGAFRLQGLVDGAYTVAVWHEVLGTREKKVEVKGGAPVAIDLELTSR
jgi:hypothetical protein